jgi:hypothetical protein
MDESSLALHIKDPQTKIVNIEFADAKGRQISSSRMSMGGANEQTRIFDFADSLPPGASMKIYLMTTRAIVRSAFKLENIPLP